jgi:hypothetical protein
LTGKEWFVETGTKADKIFLGDIYLTLSTGGSIFSNVLSKNRFTQLSTPLALLPI